MTKTYEEIDEKIRKKEAVVVTAEEFIQIVEDKGFDDLTNWAAGPFATGLI